MFLLILTVLKIGTIMGRGGTIIHIEDSLRTASIRGNITRFVGNGHTTMANLRTGR